MTELKLPEVWLRGPLPGIHSLLQPIAHALLQAKDEVNELMLGFPDDLLWERPAGVASPAFHLQHFSGVINRLCTYARGEPLSQEQLGALKEEGIKNDKLTTKELIEKFNQQIELAIQQIKNTDEKTLNDFRGVGRAQLPSTVLGLLTHSAEHTMRHLGQLLVTVKILQRGN